MAAYSLGLTLYNLSQRRDLHSADFPPRPAGRLIWLHAPTDESMRRVGDMARRLVDEDGFEVLLSGPTALPDRDGITFCAPPADGQVEVTAFLDHWRPELIAFCDGELRPALVIEAHRRKIALMIVDGRAPYMTRGREGWYPGLLRSALASFDAIFAQNEDAARTFRKAGGALSAVAAIGRLEEESAALPCVEMERETLARLLLTRPIWFAAHLHEAEEDAVIAAHRVAMGLAHRSLLIVSPETAERALALADKMTALGLSVAVRANDDEPDSETEVYLVEGMSELGLWYRLAPISFLGGSLFGDGCLRSPMEAAALGSAILHGPRTQTFSGAFARLAALRATRPVMSVRDLCEAVADVLAPDKAALLAQSAWIVASDGAEVTERVIDAIRKLTDGDT
jgi:3-deoxy-D-manno-octulosonic-acid transferase